MPLELSVQDLVQLWDANEKEIRKRKKRQDYYDGKQAVLDRHGKTYKDQTEKTGRVSNWIGFIIKQYVGTLTDAGFQVSNDERDEEETVEAADGAAIYEEIADANDFKALDVENLRAAMVAGVSPEVHEFIDSEIRIDNSSPTNWVFIYDTTDELVGALYRVTLQPGAVHNGEYLRDEMELMTFYDDSRIIDYERAGDNDFREVANRDHFYGTPPVVDWHVNEFRVSFITDDLIGQQDEYNEVDSIGGDNIRRNANAILGIGGKDAMSGFDTNWIKENFAEILERRYAPTTDMKWVEHTEDIQPFVERLKRTREHIHMSGQVPDVAQIVGATGVTSGIALKLKFLPMHRTASSIINYLKRSMRRRIRLINAVLEKQGKDLIEDVNITINFSLPTNRRDQAETAQILEGLVSKRTRLEQLDFIEDVDREFNRIATERDEEVVGTSTDEENVARQEAVKENQSIDLAPKIDEVIDLLSEGLVDKLLRDGTLERAANRRQETAANNGGEG